MTKRFVVVALAAFGMLLGVACGNGDDNSLSGAAVQTTTTTCKPMTKEQMIEAERAKSTTTTTAKMTKEQMMAATSTTTTAKMTKDQMMAAEKAQSTTTTTACYPSKY